MGPQFPHLYKKVLKTLSPLHLQQSLGRTASFPAAAAAESLQSCPTLCDRRRQPTRLPRPWDSPGKNTGVGCHFLLQFLPYTQQQSHSRGSRPKGAVDLKAVPQTRTPSRLLVRRDWLVRILPSPRPSAAGTGNFILLN